jgi:hypothetical protein
MVKIKLGEYRNAPVVEQSFKLVKGFQTGKKGGYVTVRNDGQFDINIPVVKIKVESEDDFEVMGQLCADTVDADEVEKVEETEEQAVNRIRNRFRVLDKMAAACISDKVRSLIVTGPPGVGKSHGVEKQLEKASLFERVSGRPSSREVVKGAISGIGLYVLLYKFSDKGSVLVFDDCDVWEDQDAINLLKAALDTKRTRTISWNKDSSYLRKEDIPNSFKFNGSIIFITNADMKARRAGKIGPHLEALKDRCHYLDLTINTARDRILRVRQVHADAPGGLFKDHGLSEEQSQEILDFMWKERDSLGDVSMRLALKIADLYNVDPEEWKMLAITLCAA